MANRTSHPILLAFLLILQFIVISHSNRNLNDGISKKSIETSLKIDNQSSSGSHKQQQNPKIQLNFDYEQNPRKISKYQNNNSFPKQKNQTQLLIQGHNPSQTKSILRNIRKQQPQSIRLLVDCLIIGCSQCSTTTTCKKCMINYVLDKGKCFKPNQFPQNCLKASKTGTQIRYYCSQCSKGYTLNSVDGFCEKCGAANCDYCIIFSLENCLTCSVGYYLSSTSCKKCQQNCRDCRSSTNCSSCDSGYLLNSNQTCIKCQVQNCIDCSTSQTCTKCKETEYYLNNGKCEKNSSMTIDNSTNNNTVINYSKFSFQIVLDTDYNRFVSLTDEFKTQLATLIVDNTNMSTADKKKLIEITQIKQGSVNVTGSVSATSNDNLQKTYDNFVLKLKSGTQIIEGINIIFTTIIGIETLNQSSTSVNIIFIIIGAAGGAVALIVVSVIVYFCACRKKPVPQDAAAGEEKISVSTGGVELPETQKNQNKDKNKKVEEQQNSQKHFVDPPLDNQKNWVNPQYFM